MAIYLGFQPMPRPQKPGNILRCLQPPTRQKQTSHRFYVISICPRKILNALRLPFRQFYLVIRNLDKRVPCLSVETPLLSIFRWCFLDQPHTADSRGQQSLKARLKSKNKLFFLGLPLAFCLHPIHMVALLFGGNLSGLGRAPLTLGRVL